MWLIMIIYISRVCGECARDFSHVNPPAFMPSVNVSEVRQPLRRDRVVVGARRLAEIQRRFGRTI